MLRAAISEVCMSYRCHITKALLISAIVSVTTEQFQVLQAWHIPLSLLTCRCLFMVKKICVALLMKLLRLLVSKLLPPEEITLYTCRGEVNLPL